MNTALADANFGNGVSSAHDLFALTDEQILQIEPEAQDVEVFGGERSDRMDPLREDLALLASDARNLSADDPGEQRGSSGKGSEDGLQAVATMADTTANTTENTTTQNALADTRATATDVAPTWLAERMNDPQHGADARALWDGMQLAHQEASAFREVFAKPEDARAAAVRVRTLDEIDRAYFGAAGNAPEQTSASRAQLAARMLREDPAAFREMVFAGLRALEAAGNTGAGDVPSMANAAASARQTNTAGQDPAPATTQAPRQPHDTQLQHHNTQRQHETQQQQDSQRQQEARIAAYASFERAANEDLERAVGGAISRTLQEALPHAGKTQNGAALTERLSGAIRQDVEKALQGDRALGEQVARILSGQRLDDAARAQVVRLIGERAQQLVPGAARRVLADWTQTTLSAHGARSTRDGDADRSAAPANSSTPASTTAVQYPRREIAVTAKSGRNQSREFRSRIDYRKISDEQILDS